jgi:short/branched chain acyl-CoA dehydrogenase
MENNQNITPQILTSLFQNGFMGLEIPYKYNNGSNMNFTSACLTIEELARVDPSVALLVDIQNKLVVNAVRFWGSEELKDEILPRLATDTISSFCLSEANSGSDAFSMQTKAELVCHDGDGDGDGDGDDSENSSSYYIINGSKLWISNAKEAGILLVFANVDSANLGYKGITAFVIDANTEGIHIGKPESKLGLKSSSTCPITFDNVKVKPSRVLGEVGKGYKYCIEILNEGRIGIGAQQIGIAKGCMDIVMPYMFERKQFGKYIGDFQSMQHQYAQLATEIHAAEVMLYNACRLKENNQPFVKEASMVKLYSSQVAAKVTSQCIELLGGLGFTTDTLVEKFYRDCKVGSIYEGTSNIQLQTIAKMIKEEHQ